METDTLAAIAGFLQFSEAYGGGPAHGFLLTGLLFVIAFAAGVIDGVAGGGGLLTIPSLMMAGLSPQTALGTNKLLAAMGTTMSLARFARSHLVLWRMALLGIPFTLFGSAVGARLILYLPQELLGKLLIVLLPVGILLTLAPKRERRAEKPLGPVAMRVLVPLISFVIGMYDGFFGPGTGSFFIIAFHFALRLDFTRASATTKAFNLASNVSALTVFFLNGKVLVPLGALFGVGSILGNYCGSQLAIAKGQGMVRRFLAFSLAVLFASLIYKYWLQ